MTKQTFNIRLEVESLLGRPLFDSELHAFTSLRRMGYANPIDILRALTRSLANTVTRYQISDSSFYHSNAHMEQPAVAALSQTTRALLFNLIEMKSRLIQAESERKESGK